MKTTHTEIIVRGYHLDYYRHVNNARYLEFLEEARWNHFEQAAIDFNHFTKQGLAFTVVNINISYKLPAVLGDVAVVSTQLHTLGNTSVTFLQTVKRKSDDAVFASAEVTFVLVDMKKQRAVRLTDTMRSWLQLSDSE